MKVMILAAGLGTRLTPITNKIPKAVVPLLNVPMLFYPFHHFSKVSHVVINSFHLPHVLKTVLQKNSRNFGAEIISDGEKILGSGGGIKNAQSFFENEKCFCVTNADSIFLADDKHFLEKAKNLHEKNQALSTLVVIDDPRVEKQNWGGIWVDAHDRIVGFGKIRPDNAVRAYHFVGFHFLSDKIFKFLPKGESHIFDQGLAPALAKGETVQFYKTTGTWFETGDPNNYMLTTRILLNELIKKNPYLVSLQKQFHPNFKIYDSKSFDLNSSVNTATLEHLLVSNDKNITWGSGIKLEGDIVIGNNVFIDSGVHMNNAVVFESCTVVKNADVKNEIIF